jgi:hypothetical protein
MTVSPGDDVYHRGGGKFAHWKQERDKKVRAPVNHTDPKKVGSGKYIQCGDGKRLGKAGKKR